MIRRFLILTLVLGLPLAAAAEDQAEPSLEALSLKLDQLYRFDSSRGKMRMSIKTPHYERELTMRMWTQGRDFALVRILAPRKESGISTLKRENEMWNYLPKIDKTIRIPPSLMAGSWMGSDLTNDDLVRDASWQKDYMAKKSESQAGEICVQFDAKKDAAVAWDKVIACLDEEALLPTHMDFYDEKDRKARTMIYSDRKMFDGQMLPARLTLKPLLKDGNETVIVYEELEFNVKHKAKLFTLSSLKKGK